ncbi:hypothetical protein [Allosalinactinospora lopnorensis]|uniref:hypothetical protein n=1 Tax=Allosalinactinospora lopnorensis TaxID=1352348 RepID=UPI000623D922|nr:hypothetical protein [Allosalinactinospora lopnorensis]
MSLLLMLLALIGAVAVLGLGALVMDRLRQGSGPRQVDWPQRPPPATENGPTQVGGYTLLSGAVAEEPPPLLPEATVARVRQLVAEGQELDAIRFVQAQTGVDVQRAREVVAWIRDGRL